MIGKVAIIVFLVMALAVFWFLDVNYGGTYFHKGLLTAIAVLALYLAKSLLEASIAARIKDYKARYSFRKVVHSAYLVLLAVSAVTIWVQNPEALLVAYGIVAAGIAIALQDLIKNLAGGVMVFMTGIYRVGDRVAMDGKHGDVIDIGLMYTTILEMKGWVAGDQVTGRITSVPNSRVLCCPVDNYTKDHNFLWDEVTVPITYGSDWKAAHAKMLEIAKRETRETVELAEKGLSRLGKKYYLEKREVVPEVYFRLTDNWVELTLRYITEAKGRRATHSAISRKILEGFRKSRKVKIASQTLDIIGFPGRGKVA